MKITIKRPKTPLTLTLDMTEREAMVLRTIVRNIGGHPAGPRGAVGGLDDALRDHGIGYYDLSGENSMYFPGKWADLVENEDND